MKAKEFLIQIIGGLSLFRGYEFNATLKSHQINNQDIYRLYYIEYIRAGESYGRRGFNLHIHDYKFNPFRFPEGMNREDGFKVLSYLTDYIEKNTNAATCSCANIKTLDDALNIERLGFTRVYIDAEKNKDKVIDLFTVGGRILLFKYSELYSRYIEWYKENVPFEEVSDIYNKIGIEFSDIDCKSRKRTLQK
jgi:hypothetical protein